MITHEIADLEIDQTVQDLERFVRYITIKSTAKTSNSNIIQITYTMFSMFENSEGIYIPYEDITIERALEWVKDREDFIWLEKMLTENIIRAQSQLTA
jgi:hypothetical protein